MSSSFSMCNQWLHMSAQMCNNKLHIEARRLMDQVQVLVAPLSLTCYRWLQFESGSER